MTETILDWIGSRASQQPGAIALLSPGRSPLSYRGLCAQIESTATALAGLGIKGGDRVAVVLPNGPEMAVAFLSIARLATFAPLNPAFSRREFQFYLGDLKARLLIVQSGNDTPAREVARGLGIPVIELQSSEQAEAGVFSLTGAAPGDGGQVEYSRPEDTAIIFHTSGTTSHPKIVPLTHANLAASSRSTAESLELTPADRSLNILPLFHLHGLIGGVVSSLITGASVICTPGLVPDRILEWLMAFSPTWYTAAPTMHQVILEIARRQPEAVGQLRLRFIRSASAALPRHIAVQLEDIFCVPVIEAYGMSEAAPMISSNPLPPRVRKPGSVGLPYGCEVAVLASDGTSLPAGAPGEIAVRGPNVMAAYENNPEANTSSFVDGWLRSGDLGFRDQDGYIFIHGRIKEMINRGGEKIVPEEIDQVLLQHPAVLQAAAFGVPHRTLGEDVAAAVVLRPGQAASALEIRRFAIGRLAEFKVPRQIVFMSALPLGPTGKIQRLGLKEKLSPELGGADGRAEDFVAPSDDVELRLAKIWQEILGVERVGLNDDFFQLGGNSLLAAGLFAGIEKQFGCHFPISVLIEYATLAGVARLIRAAPSAPVTSLLAPMQLKGLKAPLFLAPGGLGDVLYLRDVVRHLGEDHPVYGLQSVQPDLRSKGLTSVPDLARRYLVEIRARQPHGPYFLAGHSSGGIIVYEIACQLLQAGERLGLVALIDTNLPGIRPKATPWERARIHARNFTGTAGFQRRIAYLRARLDRLFVKTIRSTPLLNPAARAGLIPDDRMLLSELLLDTYSPPVLDASLTLFRAARRPPYERLDPLQAWNQYAREIDVVDIPGDHWSLVFDPQARELAGRIRERLD